MNASAVVNMLTSFWPEIRGRGIEVFVETGTWEGDTSSAVASLFPAVFTIELSPQLFRKNIGHWKNTGVHFLLGDSAAVVPMLSDAFSDVPVAWFLDAHWFISGARAGRWKLPIPQDNKYPVWQELETIRSRTQPDLVIVDDRHCFYKLGGPKRLSKRQIELFLGDRLLRSEVWEDCCVEWMK